MQEFKEIKEFVTQEIATLKQTKLLEIKNRTQYVKNPLKSLNNRISEVEESQNRKTHPAILLKQPESWKTN